MNPDPLPTAPRERASAGVRVLDLSRVLAGPWCTQTLADLGAEVIKIERPPGGGHPGGDDTRGWGPPFLKDRQGRDTAEAAYYLGTNRNKRSVTIDMAQPEGQALVLRLADSCDVLVENFKVGDMARYGLDAATLRRRCPRLVYCSITGFGQTGPYRERAGYDYAIQGMGGLMSVTGERDDLPGGGPQKVGVAVADLFTGMYATVAILAALRHRDATGEGQAIDMALLDTQVAMLANLGANYLVTRQPPRRAGNAHQNIVPYQVFEVADGHLILAVGNDQQFERFCAVAGCPELARDERFARNADARAPPRHAGAAAGRAAAPAAARRLAGRAGGRQGALRPDQRPRRGLCRPAGARARHDGDRAAPAQRRAGTGGQPDEAVGDAGAAAAAAAAAGPAHRRGAGRDRHRRGRPGRTCAQRGVIGPAVP